jgi:hypothetical protein
MCVCVCVCRRISVQGEGWTGALLPVGAARGQAVNIIRVAQVYEVSA